MKEEVKETLEEEYEKIKDEVNGKSEEELREMEKAAREEMHVAKIKEAGEYVYNILDLGPKFDEDDFIGKLDEIAEKNSTPEGNTKFAEETYSDFTDDEEELAFTIVNLGYGNFGKEFISNMIDKDKDSAKKVMEIIIQQFWELQDIVNYVKENADTMLEEKRKEEDSKSN